MEIRRSWRVACRLAAVRAAVVVSLLAVGLGSCAQSDKSVAQSQAVRLGALFPLSGDFGPSGQRMAQAAEMAIKEANADGGVLGRQVELLTGDDACDAGAAVKRAHELVGRDITVSVGGACSVATAPALKVFRSAGIPMIIPAANSTDLLVPGYDSVFLLSGTTELEARRAVAVLADLNVHRLAVIHDGTSFSQTLAAATVENVRRPGSPIAIAAELVLAQGADSYRRMADAVLQQRADVVFFTGYYREAATLIRDLRAAGYTGKIMLSDGGTDPTLFTLLSAAEAEGVYGVTLPMPQFEPRASAWAARYKAAYGEYPGPLTMQAYDAVRLALDGIRRAGSLDRDAVRKAIANTTPRDVALLSGPSEFNANGTQVEPTFILLRIHNSEFTLVR